MPGYPLCALDPSRFAWLALPPDQAARIAAEVIRAGLAVADYAAWRALGLSKE